MFLLQQHFRWVNKTFCLRVTGHCVKVSELDPEACITTKDSGNLVLFEDLFLIRLLLMQFTV